MLKLASVTTAEDLERKLAAKVEAMNKEASELMKIAAQSKKDICKLWSSAEKQHAEFTNSKDSDQDFLQVALNLDKAKNCFVLLLSKSAEDSATTVVARYQEEQENVIQAGPPDSQTQKILLNHLDGKLRSISQYFLAVEKELSGMEDKISGIITEVSQLAASIKNFTGTRADQFLRYSEESKQLFGLEVKLERVCFKLVGVSSMLENLEQSQLEDNTEVRREESSEDDEENQENNRESGKTIRQSSMTSEDTSLLSVLEEEELHLSSRSEDPNTEVSPVPAPAPSGSHSNQLREVIQHQIENFKKNLGAYSSFSLPLGCYQSLNVFYVEGTPSKFWLSIDTGALTEFNSLIKVRVFLSFFAPSTNILFFRSH